MLTTNEAIRERRHINRLLQQAVDAVDRQEAFEFAHKSRAALERLKERRARAFQARMNRMNPEQRLNHIDQRIRDLLED